MIRSPRTSEFGCACPARLLVLSATIILSSALVRPQSVKSNDAPPEVTIPGSQSLMLFSSVVGQEYRLFVNLPRGYDDTTKSFPLLVLLDAQWDFPLLQALNGQQYYDGFIPGVVTVGITWGGPNPKPDSLRVRDFTPTTVSGAPQSGHADAFLKFIRTEFLPFVESRFRVRQEGRALMGSSLGGLFTLYAMMQEPRIFERFALTSPAIGWDNAVLLDIERRFAANERPLPVRLSMAQGELEDGTPAFRDFVKTLESRQYKGLSMESRILHGMGHSGGKAEGYTRGLQWIYAPRVVTLSASLLDSYAGIYEVGPGFTVRVVRDGDHVVVHPRFGPAFPMYPTSETDFFRKGSFLLVRVTKNADGKVTGLDVRDYNRSFWARKSD